MNYKKIISALTAITLFSGNLAVFAEETEKKVVTKAGENITLGDYSESAAETQKLIDNRPDVQRMVESLDRGVVAVRNGSDVLVSWRWLGTESADVKYNVYKDGVKLNAEPLNATNYMDNGAAKGSKYTVTAVVDGTESEQSKEAVILEDGYLEIPLQRPDTPKMITEGEGENAKEVDVNTPYNPCEATVADLDGDKEYEIILKWDPRYVRDASKTGFTGDCVVDAYEMDGTLMWRVNMGKNIRSGPHDTQFMVYDFDNDGKAEMACRTADGTVAGDGTVIGDKDKDWAVLNSGKNLQGPLYLTVFNGEDGTIMDTVDYEPQTFGKDYDQTDWGDGYGNRSERYLGGIACVDGVHTSFQMSRGYYSGSEGPLGGRTVVASYHIEDKKIVKDWVFDTKENKNWYLGQGNHSQSSADIDYDGKDEIIFGALVLDDDGTVMYSTDLGHGDAQHTGDLIPSRPGLETFSVHEWRGVDYVYETRDARTGEILMGSWADLDNGRGCAADIDPNHEGVEAWSLAKVLYDAEGEVLSTSFSLPINFTIWWDGDLGRELQDENKIYKYDPKTMSSDAIFRADGCTSTNSGKSTPALTADIFGDWREEAIYPTEDGSALRIFVASEPTSYRIPTLMHDTLYRNQVATQNVCYNQPTHTSFYLGFDTTSIPVPQVYTVEDGKEIRNPDLAKKEWSLDTLTTQQKQELVIDCENARVNGKIVKIDYVKPFVNNDNRTMVPLRFIAESFNCDVAYDHETRGITITDAGTEIKMTLDVTAYSVNGEAKEMDTVPVIQNDTTLVPVRMIAEAFDKKVGYYSEGLVTVADENADEANPTAVIEKIKSGVVAPKQDIDSWARKAVLTAQDAEGKDLIVASANQDNAKNVIDGDFATTWKGNKDDSIYLHMGRGGSISALGVAFADGKPHTVKIETGKYKWEDGKIIDTTWTVITPAFTFDGEVNECLDYIIGITKYDEAIRITCLDDYGMEISEAAVIEVD